MADKRKNEDREEAQARTNAQGETRAAQDQTQEEDRPEDTYSQPVTNDPVDSEARAQETLENLNPAPAGGVEGSNFAGGTDGVEDPVLVGREEYRVEAEETKRTGPNKK